MPSRKIKPSYTVVTGSISSRINNNLSEFEGPLEWQFLILLEFDWENEIESFEVQPVTIQYGKSPRGRQYSYTPDVLVNYRDGRPPCLFEIKPRYYLRKKWPELKRKLRAGIHYARSHSMRFKIVTDKEIFTPFLENARFFRSFKYQSSPESDVDTLLLKLTETGITTPRKLLKAITDNSHEQADLVPTLWHLVATRRIGVDMYQKIHMESPVWPVSNREEE